MAISRPQLVQIVAQKAMEQMPMELRPTSQPDLMVETRTSAAMATEAAEGVS